VWVFGVLCGFSYNAFGCRQLYMHYVDKVHMYAQSIGMVCNALQSDHLCLVAVSYAKHSRILLWFVVRASFPNCSKGPILSVLAVSEPAVILSLTSFVSDFKCVCAQNHHH